TAIYRDSLKKGISAYDISVYFSEHDIDSKQISDVELLFERIKNVYTTLDKWTSSSPTEDNLSDVPVPVIPKPITVVSSNTSAPRTPLTPYYNARQQYNTMQMLKPTINDKSHFSSKLSKQRLQQLKSFSEEPIGSILLLLVAVYSTLSLDEFARLGPHIWNKLLNDREHRPFASASFLFIQCSEKSPDTIKELIMKDLYSTNVLIRAITIRKISSLFGHRNQLLTQPYVSEPGRKRPFRAQAPAIPFVPAELGSQEMMYEPYRIPKMTTQDTLTADVRKIIQELSWEEDDNIDDHIKRIKTPISALPTFYLDEEEFKAEEEMSFQMAHEKAMSIRISGNPLQKNNMQLTNASKRRAISIPILSSFSLRLVDLLDDAHGGVCNLTKELITYFLRDDPHLFLRIFFSDLGTSNFDTQKELISRIRFLISMQH
ncbi:24565_t:CDS:2, partial [Racocetra persica]